ncbi:MAG: PorT family protein [Bacteroidetes bacterium]|nr:PorT family protein [Bacteroidota bacterium]
MKRLFQIRGVVLLIILMWAIGLQAQGSWEVGGGLTLNSSWIVNQNSFEILEKVCSADPLIAGSEPGYGITLGLSAGALATYNSESFWSAQIEANYTKAGQNYKESWSANACENDLSDFKRKFTLHYFQLPMLMRFRSQNRGKVKGYGEIGPQIGILIGAKEEVTLSGEEPSGVEFTPAKDKVKTFDLGIVVGGGADITVSKNIYINVGLRTTFGFLDINNGDSAAFISNNDIAYQKSRNFQIGVNVGVHYTFDWIGGMYR